MGLLDEIAQGLLEAVFPTRCAGCDMPGSLLCARCLESMRRIDPDGACPRCGAPYGHIVCTECWDTEYAFEAACAVTSLERPLSRAVTLYKDGGERRLGEVLAGLIAETVEPWREWPQLVVPVPATPRAVRERGFDHIREISRRVALRLDIPFAAAICATQSRDLRELGRVERRAEVVGAFNLSPGVRVPPRVLLVDDVLTTGSTLDAAARTLLDAGAERVRGAVIARAW